jgi:glutathione S-transferase
MTTARERVLYHSVISGNSYKCVLAARQLGLPVRVVLLDLVKGEVRTPEFRAKNPFGRVPFLEDGDFTLAESNAILCYLARGTRLFPDDPQTQARILQWLFWEQNQAEPGLAIPRYFVKVAPDAPMAKTVIEVQKPRGVAALKTLERHLAAGNRFLVGEYSIADIAVFAYVHVAGDAGFELAEYPRVQEWIARVKGTEGFVAM